MRIRYWFIAGVVLALMLWAWVDEVTAGTHVMVGVAFNGPDVMYEVSGCDTTLLVNAGRVGLGDYCLMTYELPCSTGVVSFCQRTHTGISETPDLLPFIAALWRLVQFVP